MACVFFGGRFFVAFGFGAVLIGAMMMNSPGCRVFANADDFSRILATAGGVQALSSSQINAADGSISDTSLAGWR